MSQVILPKIEDKMIEMIDEGTTFSSLKRRAFWHLALRPYDIYVVTHKGKIDQIENSSRGMAQIAIFSAAWSVMIFLAVFGLCMTTAGTFGQMPVLMPLGLIACLLAMLYSYPVAFGLKR